MLPQILVSSLMMGFVYALVAVGLALIWGVMDVINFAHGDFMMLGMYTAFWAAMLVGIDPLISLPLGALVLFVLGLIVYKWVIKPVLDAPPLSALLITFGLALFLRNLALFFWGPNYRMVRDSFLQGRRIIIGNVAIGVPQLVASLGCIAATMLLYYFITYTRTGKAIRAASLDREAAQLVGIDIHRINAITFGLGAASAGLAGVFLVNFYYVFPEVGLLFGLLSFIIVALGGFGNIIGAFWAGILLGVVEGLGGFYIGPIYKYVVVFGLYLVVIYFRPQGLFGW